MSGERWSRGCSEVRRGERRTFPPVAVMSARPSSGVTKLSKVTTHGSRDSTLICSGWNTECEQSVAATVEYVIWGNRHLITFAKALLDAGEHRIHVARLHEYTEGGQMMPQRGYAKLCRRCPGHSTNH